MFNKIKIFYKKVEAEYNWLLDVIAGPCDECPVLGVAMIVSLIFLLTAILI